jgi:hypothetical protein
MSTRYHSAIIKAHSIPPTTLATVQGAQTAAKAASPVLVSSAGLKTLHNDASIDDFLAEADALVEEAERLAAVQMTGSRLDSIDRLCAQVDSLFDD